MKKPNITEGKWWVNTLGQHHNNTNIQQHEICWSSDGECVVDHVYSLADAKAISAVPELLDDAIRKYNWMIRLKFTHPHLVPDEEIEQTYQALKKAGCEFN